MTPKIPPALRQAIERYRPRRAILFGSAARGEADAASDYDILMVKETTESFVRRLITFARLLPLDGPRVDAFIYTPEEFTRMRDSENPLVARALKEGVTLYETDA